MRVYGVYQFDNYPVWNVLVTDFNEYNHSKIECLRGLAFLRNGKFDTEVELDLSRLVNPLEVGYIYNGLGAGTLKLIF